MSFLSSFYPQPVVAGTTEGTFAEGNHTHGNLTNDGKIGATSGLPLVTTTAGAVTTLALGTANQVLRVNSGATGVEFGAGFDAAAPPAIGNTTPNSGAFTTLNATGETELVNGTNAAGPFRLYNTSSASNANFERGFMRWSSNVLEIGTEAAGTGTNRSLQIRVGAATYTFNAVNLLTSGGSFAAASSGGYLWFNRGRIVSQADGVYTWLNNAQNDFDRLQFGGTTSSFPALKRNSTTLEARLADDTAYTAIQGKLTTETAYTAGAPTATGYLVLYDSNGTAYKVPAEAL